MENSTGNQEHSRVMKKIDRIKSYYMHVAAYILMSAFILIAWAIDTKLPESFWKTSIFIIIVIGGLGLLTHSVIHFGSTIPFVKKWEQKKLLKIIEKDKFNENQTKS
jgi:hypothetical protein